jgi:hypothetical protein
MKIATVRDSEPRLNRERIARGSAILVAAVSAAGLIAASTPNTPVKGVSYRVRTQTAMPTAGGPGGGGGDQPAGGRGFGGGGGQLVRIDMAGNRAKVEFQLGAPPGSSITDYFLMIVDSNKVYRVNPDSQTYADAVLGGMGMFGGRGTRGGGAAFGGRGGGTRGNRSGGGGGGNPGRGGGDNPGRGGRSGFVNPMQILQDLIITSVKVQTEDLGAGEAIENRPTHHYMITGDYEFKLYGQPRTAKTTTEVWTIDFPAAIVDPFETPTVAGDSLSYAGIAARLAAEEKKVPGVHVKSVTTQTIPLSMAGGAEGEVSASGEVAQTVSIVRTTTITALKEVEIDDATLSIPEGYRKVSGVGRPGGQ